MAKKAKRPTGEIQRLLDERRQIEQWLQRLDTAADKTPGQVRARVRSEYQARLDAILGQLQDYRDELTEALDQQKQRRDDLVKQEAEASETLAEAELRHSVGEFDEQKWSEVRSEILESLDSVREDLKTAEDEIASLEGVMASVAVPSAGEEVPEPEEAPAEVSGVEAVEAEADAEPAAADVGDASESEPAQTDAFDELAFLKSVTDDKSPVPRPSGSHRIGGRVSTQDLASPMDVVEPGDEDKGRSSRGSLAVGAEGVKPVDRPQDQPTKGSRQKTVKCGECGALNLPTEWYCERCGAELASV